VTSGPESAPRPSMPYPPGSILAGKYRVERLLGEGGMGWVVLATHLQLDQRVALKFMHATHAMSSPEAVVRFLREARAAARIQSEHVARVSDVGTLENSAPFLVMEYLEGQDLDSLLQVSRRLPVELAVDYVLQACEGLAEAHAAGIVHRDLKPANLFLAQKSDGSVRVKLLDFGISKMSSTGTEAAVTHTQALMGSPLYMAPEQMRSTKLVDRRADIWSMGVILYEMLAGTTPFGGDTLPEICARILADPPASLRKANPAVPVRLEAAVSRCLEKDPDGRYSDAAALAQAVAPFGPPEAAAMAERIGRVLGARSMVVRPSLASRPSVVAERSASPSLPTVASKTSASFGASTPAAASRRRFVPWALAGATLLAGIVAAAGVIGGGSTAKRVSMPPPAGAVNAGASPGASVSSSLVPARPTSEETEMAQRLATVATPTAVPVAPVQATAAATVSATPQAASGPASGAAAATALRGGRTGPLAPRSVPAKPTVAKPIGTSAFGGRD
jgi:eukaryotic-like serine/threonine-protein kinase